MNMTRAISAGKGFHTSLMLSSYGIASQVGLMLLVPSHVVVSFSACGALFLLILLCTVLRRVVLDCPHWYFVLLGGTSAANVGVFLLLFRPISADANAYNLLVLGLLCATAGLLGACLIRVLVLVLHRRSLAAPAARASPRVHCLRACLYFNILVFVLVLCSGVLLISRSYRSLNDLCVSWNTVYTGSDGDEKVYSIARIGEVARGRYLWGICKPTAPGFRPAHLFFVVHPPDPMRVGLPDWTAFTTGSYDRIEAKIAIELIDGVCSGRLSCEQAHDRIIRESTRGWNLP